MEKISLKAQKRTIIGRKVKQLRTKGLIPANIYGKKIDSFAVSLDAKEFLAVFAKVGETGLLELLIDGQKRPVLVHQVSYHPVTGTPVHIDFLQVDLKQKVTTKVPLVLVGEAPAVKEKVGVLLTLLSEVEVEALPSDLPEKIELSVSSLSQIGQTMLVSSIPVSEKIKILTSPEHEIVKVAPLVSKEAEKMAAEAAAQAAAASAAAAPVESTAAGTPATAGAQSSTQAAGSTETSKK